MKLSACAVGVALLSFSAAGFAQEPPPSSWSLPDTRLIVSAERLTTVLYWHSGPARAGVDATVLSGGDTPNPFATPRLALDAVVSSGLTLGGSAGVQFSGTDVSNQLDTSGQQTSTTYLLAPRVGWLLPISEKVGFWPRAGLSYVSTNFELAANETSSSWLNLSLEPALLFTPLPHVGLTLAPALDIPLSHTQESRGELSFSGTGKTGSYGVTAGLALLL